MNTSVDKLAVLTIDKKHRETLEILRSFIYYRRQIPGDFRFDSSLRSSIVPIRHFHAIEFSSSSSFSFSPIAFLTLVLSPSRFGKLVTVVQIHISILKKALDGGTSVENSISKWTSNVRKNETISPSFHRLRSRLLGTGAKSLIFLDGNSRFGRIRDSSPLVIVFKYIHARWYKEEFKSGPRRAGLIVICGFRLLRIDARTFSWTWQIVCARHITKNDREISARYFSIDRYTFLPFPRFPSILLIDYANTAFLYIMRINTRVKILMRFFFTEKKKTRMVGKNSQIYRRCL